MIEIILPWPDKRLSPNARVHWRVKAEATAIARQNGKINALTSSTAPSNLMLFRDQNITYKFYPPTKHKRDDDNFKAMMKPYRDGIADAYNIDDNRFHTQPAEWGDVTPGGKVEVRLEELGDD